MRQQKGDHVDVQSVEDEVEELSVGAIAEVLVVVDLPHVDHVCGALIIRHSQPSSGGGGGESRMYVMETGAVV